MQTLNVSVFHLPADYNLARALNLLVKPQDNILISSSGKPLLADFGLSVALSHSTTVSTAHGSKGTTRWLAIELLNPDSIPSHTEMSDIWAFGMVIYVCLQHHLSPSLPEVTPF